VESSSSRGSEVEGDLGRVIPAEGSIGNTDAVFERNRLGRER